MLVWNEWHDARLGGGVMEPEIGPTWSAELSVHCIKEWTCGRFGPDCIICLTFGWILLIYQKQCDYKLLSLVPRMMMWHPYSCLALNIGWSHPFWRSLRPGVTIRHYLVCLFFFVRCTVNMVFHSSDCWMEYQWVEWEAILFQVKYGINWLKKKFLMIF